MISTTFIANIVSTLVFVFPLVGLEILDPESFANTVAQVVAGLTTLYVFIGRYRAGGISAFGFRIKKNDGNI